MHIIVLLLHYSCSLLLIFCVAQLVLSHNIFDIQDSSDAICSSVTGHSYTKCLNICLPVCLPACLSLSVHPFVISRCLDWRISTNTVVNSCASSAIISDEDTNVKYEDTDTNIVFCGMRR